MLIGGIVGGGAMTVTVTFVVTPAPDQPFDPNYHQKTDTLDHVDRVSLGINGGGVAYAVALYSQDLSGRNGVPVAQDRTRHLLTKS